MRIAGGRLSGRVLAAPSGRSVRPTGARLRAALFDILTHNAWPVGAAEAGAWPFDRVVDLFAGSGALGIEALSRGSRHVTFFERDRAVRAVLERNLATLGLGDAATVWAGDALRPPAAAAPAALLLVDPPYGSGLAEPALEALDHAGWIAPAAVAALELPKREDPPSAAGFAVAIDRLYGGTRLVVLARG